MKVLAVTNLFPNRLEPTRATFNYQQLNNLAEQCDLEIIAPISWLTKLNNIVSFGKFVNYKLKNSSLKVYYPTYFYTPKIFRCAYGIFYFISIFLCASYCHLKDKKDLFFGTWAFPDSYAVILLGIIFRKPTAIKVHGSDIHSVDTKCRKKLTSWALRRADIVISVSEDLAKKMHSEFSIPLSKIEVVRNGIDKERFYPIAKTTAIKKLDLIEVGARNILFIGNLKPEKCPHILLEAFSELSQKEGREEKIVLHFVGGGPMEALLIDNISKYNLQESVVLHGVVSHELIPVFINAVDVLVLPSLNEGMPNVVLESLACGTPVVASNVGGIPEVLIKGETGFLTIPADVNDLMNKLEEAIDKNWDKTCVSEASDNSSWKDTAVKIFSIMNKLVS